MADVLVKQEVPTKLSPETVTELRSQVRGAVLLPGEDGYDSARTIWNAMINRHPAVILRAVGASDVIAAVRFAKKNDLPISVRGGGHNIAGNAVTEGGLMLDLSGMKSIRIDPIAKTAQVEPGATLGDFDREAQAFGLATPLGINSTTGVAGLTLGGGFGWLSRKHGMTIDNLLSVDIVTADGNLRHASERENEDLFWAVRGGGGNFGVVTSFQYRLHPVGPEILMGIIVHPLSKAILEGYRKVAPTLPPELTVWAVLRKAPPLPFLAPEHHGKEVVVLALCYVGDLEAGKKAVAPIQALGKPYAEAIGPSPFAGWQTAFDPLLTPGSRNYWKSHNFLELSDGLFEKMLEYMGKLPSPECEIFIAQLGGAIGKIPGQATAFPHRDVAYGMNVHTRWGQSSQDLECITWAREFYDAAAPFATGGVYVNFMPEDEAQRVSKGAYGGNYDRLAKVKAKYDPTNLFRVNQNIKPGGAA